jgi:hypothetical protein
MAGLQGERVKRATLTMALLTGFSAFATGTIRTERADGSFEVVESADVVDGYEITIYRNGKRKESFNDGKIINTYYANGKKESSYNYNFGNEKYYVFDPETGERSEPKYESKYW